MDQFIRKTIRGPVGPYLEALGMLLLIVAVFYAALLTTGCYEPVVTSTITSWESQRRSSQRPDFRVRLEANARQAAPGAPATRTLGGDRGPGHYPGIVSLDPAVLGHEPVLQPGTG